ncbi:MAG TPA: hypothetical protein VLA34_04185 [Candidatus Krumholzibacterium sp.]|nr:hypothetical protein [Candidatus Krumholzibacterium sp.]
MKMRSHGIWVVLLAVLVSIPAVAARAQQATDEAKDPWAALRFLEGRWAGTGEGKSGLSIAERTYTFVLGGNFLRGEHRSEFEPQERNPEGEVHENFDMYSHDAINDRIVLRQFHVEGFVNRYIMAPVTGGGEIIVLETDEIENIPPGWKARIRITRRGDDEFGEEFELSPPGGGYSCYSRNTFRRVE